MVEYLTANLKVVFSMLMSSFEDSSGSKKGWRQDGKDCTVVVILSPSLSLFALLSGKYIRYQHAQFSTKMSSLHYFTVLLLSLHVCELVVWAAARSGSSISSFERRCVWVAAVSMLLLILSYSGAC